MGRSLATAVGAWVLLASALAAGGDWDPKDPAPWHVRKISRLGYARPDAPGGEATDPRGLKYLHLQVEFRPDLSERRLHGFRVTDQRGGTVAEAYGFHSGRSILVFEGDWASLEGLYLEGTGHREPLWPGPAGLRSSPQDATPPTPPRAASDSLPAAASAPGVQDAGRSNARKSRAEKGNAENGEGTKKGSRGEKGDAENGRGGQGKPSGSGDASQSGGGTAGKGSSAADGSAGAGGTGGEAGSGGTGGGKGAGGAGSTGSGGGGAGGAGAGGVGMGRGSRTASRGERGLAASLRGNRGSVLGSSRGGGHGDNDIADDAATGAGSLAVGTVAGGLGLGGGGAGLAQPGLWQEETARPRKKFVLYLSCEEEFGHGRVYQVDEDGLLLGTVILPYAATGLALHRQPALAAAVPRELGKVYQIDSAGRVSVLLENDPLAVQPVDVGIAWNSDTMVLADNLGHVLSTASAKGGKAALYRRFDLQKWDRPLMSVAVTLDHDVVLGTDMEPGIYRFAGGSSAFPVALLPQAGGVAADTASSNWAAAQPPNRILVYQRDTLVKTLRLPADKAFYRYGLLSFAPGDSVVVAARPAGDPKGQVWIVKLGVKDDSARSLFPWRREPIADFVVGPRMPWSNPEEHRRLD